ncbi:bile acid:sodium symporter [Patescibacteria group bacterium]|nr:bile acid:sodium symporter [Patescibacteria group bacterium]
MSLLTRIKDLFSENQIIIVLLGLIVGSLFSAQLRWLNDYATPLLIIVFFTSSLRLSGEELLRYGKDWRMMLIAALFMLVVLPFALFMPARILAPNWALALLIMGAMPTGMTIALVADYFGGKTSLALLITAATSLLAPFTIPLVFKIAVGTYVPIPILSMFWSLFLTIVLPLVLALLVKRAAPRLVSRYDRFFRELSVLAFGLLIAGITANSTSGNITLLPSLHDLIVLVGATLWLGTLTWVSYDLVTWRAPAERMTIALCMIYLNNTLALFIGDKFFHDQHVLPQLILLLVVVNILLFPIKYVARKITGPRPKLARRKA